jgi:HAD superfamily hydrolase (TIGR01459 family)
MAMLEPIVSLQQLAEAYEFFFVDQFGVLLDGAIPYAGAIAALGYLKSRGKTVIILSNSGRAGDYNGRRLAKLGIGPDLYNHLVTSGDVAFELVRSGGLGMPLAAATCLTISSGDDTNLADRLQLESVPASEGADLIVISGSEADKISLVAYREILRSAAARGVPAICTNPDVEMLTDGGTAPGAGAIARVYEELGGTVRWIGKPFNDIYAHAFRLCGAPAKDKVVAIGDSIEHDIAGATQFGIAAALVRTGIHSGLPDPELAEMLETGGPFRPMILPAFTLDEAPDANK